MNQADEPMRCTSCGGRINSERDARRVEEHCQHCGASLPPVNKPWSASSASHLWLRQKSPRLASFASWIWKRVPTRQAVIDWVRQDAETIRAVREMPGRLRKGIPDVYRKHRRTTTEFYRKHRQLFRWPTWLIVVGLYAWCHYSSDDPGSAPFLCYPAIVLVGVGMCIHALWIIKRKWIIFPSAILTVAVLCLWGWNDTYVVRWDNEENRYLDTYTRWGRQHVYRVLQIFESANANQRDYYYPELELKGGFAGTGKQHGRWDYVDYSEYPYFKETSFYWYGEKVTEGEWHLRNK